MLVEAGCSEARRPSAFPKIRAPNPGPREIPHTKTPCNFSLEMLNFSVMKTLHFDFSPRSLFPLHYSRDTPILLGYSHPR
jgi:hypothetical protein